MPGLVAFNRRWGIGSDDLVFPEIGEVFLRVVWLIVMAIVFSIHHEAFQCEGSYLLGTYFIGSLCLLVLNIFVASLIIYTAMQGTIINARPRKRMPMLIYIKIALVLPDIAWNSMGTYWSFSDSEGCDHHVINTVKAAVLYSWVMLFFMLIGVACVFDPLGKLSASKSMPNTPRDGETRRRTYSTESTSTLMDETAKMWEKRCRLLCCCATCDEQSNEAFTDISKLLTDYFKDIDLVPTDIAAGLMLVQTEQESQKYDLNVVSVKSPVEVTLGGVTDTITSDDFTNMQTTNLGTTPTTSSDMLIPKSWMTVDKAAYFMKFASAVYGWPLFVFANPCTGLFKLCKECRCCSCSTIIQNDNCCQCNAAAIRNVVDIRDEDIVYASYHNRIYETPFLVAYDHDAQAVVVSIRGTLSLRDALTDLTADCESLELPAFEGDCLCHRGILQAARFVKTTLENNDILRSAFAHVQGYRLVITGHSLGAGTAAVLAILLKQNYPDLICFSYSPPGGLVSQKVAEYCESFIMSVVLGKDVIPRLGIVTMEDLKANLLRNLHDSVKPKYQILASGCMKAICCKMGIDDSQRYLLDRSNSTSYTEPQNRFEEALHDAIMNSDRSRITHRPLYPPGQILYITEETLAGCCGGDPTYSVQWSKPEMFTEIVVSPKMITDHMPDNVQKALDQLSERNLSPKEIILSSSVRNSRRPANGNGNGATACSSHSGVADNSV